jgi:hypothetical protein
MFPVAWRFMKVNFISITIMRGVAAAAAAAAAVVVVVASAAVNYG